MGRYTVLEDPRADTTVQRVLDKVCSEIATLLGDNLQAIVLVGGYGRGEGGVYRVGAEYHLVNDLDLLVFVKNGLGRAKARFDGPLKQLSHQLLADSQGLKEIDIELTHVQRYRFLVPNTVGNYEVASGHQVIYGDLNLGKVMPRLDPRRLPAYEGTNYFRNRGSGLLIPAVYFLTDGLESPEKRKNFQIELQKACQAMGDACLLMAGQYHFSYRERLRRFQELKRDALRIPADLCENVAPLYEWGVTSKLTPCFEWPGDQKMIERWFEIREIFGDFFLWYESTRLCHEFKGWDEYADCVEHRGAGEPLDLRLRSVLWLALSFIQGRSKVTGDMMSPIHRCRRCLGIMPLLLFSLTPDLHVEPSLVARAAGLLDQSVSAVDMALWKKLVERYLLTFYPTGVVRDALTPLQEVG